MAHLPNDVRPMTETEIAYVIASRPNLVTFLVHPPHVVPEYPGQVRRLSGRSPSASSSAVRISSWPSAWIPITSPA